LFIYFYLPFFSLVCSSPTQTVGVGWFERGRQRIVCRVESLHRKTRCRSIPESWRRRKERRGVRPGVCVGGDIMTKPGILSLCHYYFNPSLLEQILIFVGVFSKTRISQVFEQIPFRYLACFFVFVFSSSPGHNEKSK
jgi:hypothetical protein